MRMMYSRKSGAHWAMPLVSDLHTSSDDFRRPDVMPKVVVKIKTPKQPIGMMLRLNGEGNKLPVALSSTAWGTTVSRRTTTIYKIRNAHAMRKASRC